jgi:hypothetical protein
VHQVGCVPESQPHPLRHTLASALKWLDHAINEFIARSPAGPDMTDVWVLVELNAVEAQGQAPRPALHAHSSAGDVGLHQAATDGVPFQVIETHGVGFVSLERDPLRGLY